MNKRYIYCDESCHLEHDDSDVMVLGAIDVPKELKNKINTDIKNLKVKHGLNKNSEIKWTKVSKKYLPLYIDILDYIMNNKAIRIRLIVALEKSKLEHEKYNHTHDDWYYISYYNLLKEHLKKNNEELFSIFLDIKDTHGGPRVKKLRECLMNTRDINNVIGIYQVNSHESEITQIVDLFTGALSYLHRFRDSDNINYENTKVKIINHLAWNHDLKLLSTSPYKDDKFNLFIWNPRKIGWESWK